MTRGGRRPLPWIALGLFVLTFVVFARVQAHGFVGVDDRLYVVDNPHVREGISAEGVAWAFTTTRAGNWHPLTWLSHMLDCELWGLGSGAHHLTSVLLHALSAVVLLLVLARCTAAPWPSAGVAVLFAVHPLHVESVAWAAERKDVLSGLFWMLTLAAWVGYARRPGAVRYLGALLLFGLGLLAKPMLVTLPVVLLLLDLWPLGRLRLESGRNVGRLLLEKAPFLLLSVASSVVTVLAQRSWGNVSTLEALPSSARLANAVVGYVVYIRRTLWPSGLAFFYPYPKAVPAWQVAGALLVLGALTAAALLAVRRRPYLTVGWLWYLISLLPVIGLVQVGRQAGADRYTYIPIIGLFVMACWGLAELVERGRVPRVPAATVAAVAATALAAVGVAQVSYWKDSATLYRRALDITRDNYVVEDLLGSLLAREGRPDLAVAHHTEALRIEPGYGLAHNNLANALALRGDLQGAIRHYRLALETRPDLDEAHHNLGTLLYRLGDVEGAIAQFSEAVRINPGHADARFNLAVLLDRSGRRNEALAHFEAAARLDPGDARASYAWGSALLAAGRTEEAVESLRRALSIDPGFAAAREKLSEALGATRPAPPAR